MNQNQNAGLLGALAAALICVVIILLCVLALYIFFCVSLQRTMSAIRPKNRLIPSGLVWLHLLHLGGIIPILGILLGVGAAVWDLIMVLKIAGSLHKEYKSRGWRIGNEQFGKSVGLVWAIGSLVLTPLGLLMNLFADQVGDPDLMGIFGLGLIVLYLILFICFIMYWVQIHGYGTRLREAGGGRSRRTAEEDDYDDDYQPRGRSRRRDDDEDEDDRPRGRSRRRDEDDDRPRRRPRDEEDEDDEDDRPRRRRRDEDD